MKKTIAISFYGGVVKDDTTTLPNFHAIANKIKGAENIIRIYTEGDPEIMNEWCDKNRFLPLASDECYDYLISPLAVGTPLTFDGYVDWDVMEVLLESLDIIPSTPKSRGIDKLKFNISEIINRGNSNE